MMPKMVAKSIIDVLILVSRTHSVSAVGGENKRKTVIEEHISDLSLRWTRI